MSLEEPDTATAGTAPTGHDADDTRGRHVAIVLCVAVLTILTAVAVVLVSRAGEPAKGETATQGAVSQRAAAVDAARVQAPASVPGTPVVTVGAAGADGCRATWTVADGGSPVVGYDVTLESAPAPPAADGTQVGTALTVQRTTDATATVAAGGTIRVRARNAVGDGATSEPLACG